MIVGLTGKSCSGKDTVARLLPSYFSVIDEDKLGHVALEKNKDKILEAFGESVFTNGEVDRSKLGPLVFKDERKLEKLNEITHPWMVEETLRECREIEKEGKIAVINAAILESMGFIPYCDEIIFVMSKYENRLKRALQRDAIDEEKFKNRAKNQQEIGATLFSSNKKVFTMLNDEGLEELSRQVNLYCDNIEKRGYHEQKI